MYFYIDSDGKLHTHSKYTDLKQNDKCEDNIIDMLCTRLFKFSSIDEIKDRMQETIKERLGLSNLKIFHGINTRLLFDFDLSIKEIQIQSINDPKDEKDV